MNGDLRCLQGGELACWSRVGTPETSVEVVVPSLSPGRLDRPSKIGADMSLDGWLMGQILVAIAMPIIAYYRYRRLVYRHRVAQLNRLWYIDIPRQRY